MPFPALAIMENLSVTYADGTVLSWEDFLLSNPGFTMPSGSARVEYTPDVRLSYYANDTQYGNVTLGLRWPEGDTILTNKTAWVTAAATRAQSAASAAAAAAAAAQATAPATLAKAALTAAISAYAAEGTADPKMVAVLNALKAVV